MSLRLRARLPPERRSAVEHEKSLFQVLYQDDLNAQHQPGRRRPVYRARLRGDDLIGLRSATWLLACGNIGWRSTPELEQIAAELDLQRMAATDRNVLRLAAYEMLHTDTPPRVAIDEAVELAKRFGSAQSAQFVNGILDKIMHSTEGREERRRGERGRQIDTHGYPSTIETRSCHFVAILPRWRGHRCSLPFALSPLLSPHLIPEYHGPIRQTQTGSQKDHATAEHRRPRPLQAQGRLVDDSFRHDLFEKLIKIDMGVDAAQEIADDIARKVQRPRRRNGRDDRARSRPSSRHCWPSRPSRSASPPAARP